MVGEAAPDGSLTCTRKLDVYGCVRSSSGTATSKHKFVGALGHPSDDETGLIYMRARHYDPVTGRFISEDPAKHGANWFVYCFDNPVRFVDRTGREGTEAETATTATISEALDSMLQNVGVYLQDIQKIADVKSWKAISALAQMGEDPSNWRWVVAQIGGNSSGISCSGWVKAIVCIAGRSMGEYLQLELESHPIPYGAMTGLTGE